MKKLFILPVLLFAVMATSCSKSNTSSENVEPETSVSVDDVLADAEKMVGDTVTVEGVCSHLCRHGGRKAFLLGTDNDAILRCEATVEMGGAFPQESIHHPLKVKGIVRETRIDEAALQQMEQAHAEEIAQLAEQLSEDELAQVADAPGGCDTERKAAGQADIATFDARIADYRARIAARDSAEGRPYLSQFFIEALSFEILPE